MNSSIIYTGSEGPAEKNETAIKLKTSFGKLASLAEACMGDGGVQGL